MTAVTAFCQTNDYDQTNLVSDIPGMAAHTDPKLINPWGISFFPGQPFWVADNNSGFSTLYDAAGNSQQPTVLIAPPGGSTASATPTGTVANSTSGFVVGTGPSLFLFDTEDGTISGWNGVGTNAILAVDHSAAGAVYKGLAMITNGTASFLLATNFNSAKVEVYDSAFNAAALAGSFADPTLPAGYAPFGIQVMGSQVFVTYALQDSAKHDPVSAVGNGFVSIFDFNGNFVKRFASNGTLNSPWGVAPAPAGFGAFAGAILVGNFGDGTINAFDSATGNFLGQMQDGSGDVITNSGLWALAFGAGGTGNPDTLYFTAGLAGETHGLFGSIDVSSGGGAGADFSIAASPQSATVRAGQSTQFVISASPLNGFSGTVNFSCSAPAGITCTFTPSSVNATGTAVSTTMSLATASTGPHYGPMALWMGLSGTGLFGIVMLGGETKKRKTAFSVLAGGILCLALAGTMLSSVGCGGGSSSTVSRGTASVAVTASSGTVTHTTMVSVTVN
jgi:uncharacterized protein (TIGR03118 family)